MSSMDISNRLINCLLIEECQWLESRCAENGIELIRLKGASALPRLYSDLGDRPMADVDVGVDSESQEFVAKCLLERGYVPMSIAPFVGNSNRTGYIRTHESGLELSVDLHRAPYWEASDALFGERVRDELGFWRLSDPGEALHWIVNWAEQDSMVGGRKAQDIVRLIKSRGERWDWNEFWQRACDNEHGVSAAFVLILLRRELDLRVDVPKNLICWRVRTLLAISTRKFLIDPRSHQLRYVVFRALIRPWRRMIRYHWHWLRAHLFVRRPFFRSEKSDELPTQEQKVL